MFLNSMSSENPSSGADMLDLLSWFEVNKKKVAVGAAGFLVVVVVAMVVRHFKSEGALKASADLLAVKTAWNAPTNTPPPAPADYLKVAASHSGSPAAARALIFAAGAYFAEGKFAEAESTFRKCVSDHPGHPAIAEAQYGVAASLEAQGKMDEAVTAYLNVSTTYGKTASVADDAKLALARIYESRSQPDQALRLYNELAPQFDVGGSIASGRGEAISLKADLLKKHPELDTNRVTLNTSTQVITPAPQPAVATPPAEIPAAAAQPEAAPAAEAAPAVEKAAEEPKP